MSIKLMSLVWDDHTGELNGIEKAILVKLADHSSDDGMRIFPSLDKLSLDTGFNRRTIIRHLKTLEDKKRIKIIKRKKGVINISNSYKINVDLLQKYAAKSSVDKMPKASVYETLGVVSNRHGGSVCESPDPSIKPILYNLNDPNTRARKANTSVDKPKKKGASVGITQDHCPETRQSIVRKPEPLALIKQIEKEKLSQTPEMRAIGEQSLKAVKSILPKAINDSNRIGSRGRVKRVVNDKFEAL